MGHGDEDNDDYSYDDEGDDDNDCNDADDADDDSYKW